MIWRLALTLYLLASPALAQVKQSGNVTPTHFACWTTNGTLQDCGTAAIPFPTTLGLTNGGPLCVNSGPVTGPYQAFCLSASLSGAVLSIQNFGGASTAGISFNVNGTPSNFATVPASTTNGDFACYIGTSGQLGDCGTLPATALPPGVDTSTVNIVTSTPTLTSTQCGQLTTLGGTSFYTVTVGAASGFSTPCTMTFANIDTGRGKRLTISGVTLPNGPILWPGQSLAIKGDGTSWRAISAPGLWQLPSGGATWFVDPVNGVNTNDCLAAGLGNACLSPAGALAYVCNNIDAMGQVPVIQFAADTTHYVTSVNACSVKGVVNTGFTTVPTFRGDVNTNANVRINVTGGNDFVFVNIPHAWRIEGFDIRNTSSGTGIVADVGSTVYVGINTINEGSCCNGMSSLNQALIEWTSNFTIASGANAFFQANVGGKIVAQPITVTLTGTPAWAFAFANVTDGGVAFIPGITFTGSATGNRCNIATGGGIDTSGAGSTYLPGNSGCSATGGSFGWYQ